MPSKNSGDVDSGFDSVVISAPGAMSKWVRTDAMTRPKPSAPSRDGVPPPTKTVDTGLDGSRWAAAIDSSPSSAESHCSGDELLPSSPGV